MLKWFWNQLIVIYALTMVSLALHSVVLVAPYLGIDFGALGDEVLGFVTAAWIAFIVLTLAGVVIGLPIYTIRHLIKRLKGIVEEIPPREHRVENFFFGR